LGAHSTDRGAPADAPIHGVLLAPHPITHMKAVMTLSGLMLLCASVVTGAGALIGPVQTHVDVRTLSEPAGLVVFGAGFVLLANQVRRKNKC
jgi:hypothetical protein